MENALRKASKSARRRLNDQLISRHSAGNGIPQIDDTVPVGGTTGLSHEHSCAVELAAQWYSEQRPRPSPAVPAIREKFGLSAMEACEALAMARLFQVNRKAFG